MGDERIDEDYDSFNSFDDPVGNIEKLEEKPSDKPAESAGKPDLKRVESFQSTDSFDDPPKPNMTTFEPLFATAAGVRIDVAQESIDKAKRMLINDSSNTPSSSSKRGIFTSPFIKKPPVDRSSKQFVSPFRRDEPIITTKRPASSPKKNETSGAPPAKKSTIPERKSDGSSGDRSSSRTSSRTSSKNEKVKKARKERKEIHADVLRISRMFEKDQYRLILQESHSTSLIRGVISLRRGSQIKFGDRLEFDAQILEKDTSGYPKEVYIEKVLRNRQNGARKGLQRHSIADLPFCLKPKFIYQLNDNPEIKKSVIQINILDLKIEIYEGCAKCRFLVETKEEKKYCGKCKSNRITTQPTVYCRMRVSDFSGQLFVNMTTRVSEKFMDLLGYQGVGEWFKFQEPNERNSYVFRPMLMEIEKDKKQEWEVTDVADVNWDNMADYLEKIVKTECN